MATLPQIFEEDVQEINRALHDLLLKSEANAALLIDKGGFLITHRGLTDEIDTTTMGALAAASFAATEGIASLVNEPNFRSVYQQGETFSLLVENVDEYSLLTVIFKVGVSVGAVKYYAAETVARIAKQIRVAHDRNPEGGYDLSMLNLPDTKALFSKKLGT